MDDVIALFHRYKDPVYRLALSFTGSPADAEDVTQTVFLKYLETQPELEEGKERAWLLQVTANQCRDLWRRRGRPAHRPQEVGRAVGRLVPAADVDAETRIRRRVEQMATAVEIQGVSQHLRGIVQLLRAGGIPLDYAALAHDLYQYQFPEAVAGVRLRWAQDFYRRPLEDEDNTNTSEGKED